MIRYQYGAEELQSSYAAAPEEDNWWAGVNRCAARVAITATLVAASSARIAQAAANPATEELQFVSSVDGDAHAYVAPRLDVPNVRGPVWGRDEEFVVAAASIASDDEGWRPSRPWVQNAPLRSTFGTDDEFVAPCLDEDGWQPPRPWRQSAPVPAITVSEELASAFDDEGSGPILVRWPTLSTARVFSSGDEWIITPAIVAIACGAESGSSIVGQTESSAALESGGESGSEIAGQETDVATIVDGSESGVAIVGQLASACVIENGGESGSEAVGALASVAAIEVGAEAGVSIAGGLASACVLVSGGEAGCEIASQQAGVATITSGAASGAVITGALASAGAIASGGESGVAIASGQAQTATIESGGQSGSTIVGVDEVQPSFGGGLRHMERLIDAREWAAAHLSPKNALAMTPIKTESQQRPKAHHGHVKQPKMPRPLVCVIECSVDGPSCAVVAQLHSVAEIEVHARSAAVSGRAKVSGDSREVQQVIALLALLDEVDNE